MGIISMMAMFPGKESSTRKVSFHQGQNRRCVDKGPLADPMHRGPGGAVRHAVALRQEGVIVYTGDLGALTVDLGTFGWFPGILPSEAAEASESEGADSG